MKNKKLLVGLSVGLAILIAIFAIVLVTNKPETTKGQKNIDVTIVYADKTTKVLDFETDAEFLGDVLFEEGLVTEEEYKAGYYTVVDGIKADYNVDQSWWCVTKDGEMTMVGMNELALSDGDKYEITYTIG